LPHPAAKCRPTGRSQEMTIDEHSAVSLDPPEAHDDILRVEHIAKRYGAVTALTDVNLRLERGEVLGLIGDNGAGKSTLLKIICGFQPPTSERACCTELNVTSSPLSTTWRWSTS